MIHADGSGGMDDAGNERETCREGTDAGHDGLRPGWRIEGTAVLVAGLVTICVFVSVVWFAYRHGIRNAGDTVPYVAAEPGPLKTGSAGNGSVVRDREVYDVYNGRDTGEIVILEQETEEPVRRLSAGEDDTGAMIRDRIAALSREDDLMLGEETGDAGTAGGPSGPSAGGNGSGITRHGDPAPSAGSMSAKDLSGGTHMVQVGAFRSREDAVTYWSGLKRRSGTGLEGKYSDIQRADLGERGIFYRLRVGPPVSGEQARAYCDDLRARGYECIVTPVQGYGRREEK